MDVMESLEIWWELNTPREEAAKNARAETGRWGVQGTPWGRGDRASAACDGWYETGLKQILSVNHLGRLFFVEFVYPIEIFSTGAVSSSACSVPGVAEGQARPGQTHGMDARLEETQIIDLHPFMERIGLVLCCCR